MLRDLRTYQDGLYPTFVAACHAPGIATNDNEWYEYLREAKETHSPRQLRELFGFIFAMNVPANAMKTKVHGHFGPQLNLLFF